MLRRFAYIGVVLAVAALGGPRSVVAQPVHGTLSLDAERLAAALNASSVRYPAPIQAFYAERGWSPVWTAEAGRSDLSDELHTALLEAGADGLDPLDYAPAELGADRSREETEVALSDALLRFADDLARGRVDPGRIHRDWDAKRRRLDLDGLLRWADSLGPEAALRTARPPHAAYARLREALARYCALAEAGGWPRVPPGPALRLGDEDPAIPPLRKRLIRTGDHPRSVALDDSLRFDATLEGAVRRAQDRHGLAVDGVVGPATRAALNVPATARALQLAVNMERWRWLPADLGPTHLHINAAGMWLELVENGERTLRLRTIVGTLGDPTPGFSSLITHAVFSPYWDVPESIARAEIRPRLGRDPGYLERHHMHVLANGRIRQDPGPDNPLGPVKFIFRNRFGVRLHGTSTPALFDERVRAFSHGCIRVEEPLRLAARLARGTGWDEERARAAVDQGKESWVQLAEPIPIHVAYWTAWVENDGTVQFRDDLYGRDRALVRALMAHGFAGLGAPGGPYGAHEASIGGIAGSLGGQHGQTVPSLPACAATTSGTR